MAKKQPDLIIDRGSHLFVSTNQHTGEKKLIWDWDKLLEEVRLVTGSIVTVTEAKVKRTRKKKEV